jgi:glycosyltransferase involved in cell wall biosynthesis
MLDSMRILFLTDNFPPETNAPAARTFEHARVWVGEGHEVTVITSVPNFPTGRVHEGYRNRPYTVTEMSGIRVVRVWTYISANRGRIRRSLDYLSYMVSAIPAGMLQRASDVVVGTSPQFLTVVAADAVSFLRGIPFVFELRDLWPESIAAVGAAPDGPALRRHGRVATRLYRRADRVVAVTESFRRVLERRGIPAEKIAVVRNGVDMARFAPRELDKGFRDEIGAGEGEFVVTYAGTVGMAHGLAVVLEAAARSAGEPIRYVVVGEGAEKERLEIEASERRLSNIVFLEGVPRERIPGILAASDAVLVHLKDDPLFETVLPSKMFEAMAMAKPILLGVRGESAEILRRTGSGIVFEPEDVAGLLGAVRELAADRGLAKSLGMRGREAAEREFRREAAAMRMLSVLEEVVGIAAVRRPLEAVPALQPAQIGGLVRVATPAEARFVGIRATHGTPRVRGAAGAEEAPAMDHREEPVAADGATVAGTSRPSPDSREAAPPGHPEEASQETPARSSEPARSS